MKKAVLVTGHYLDSKRKAGFHWIANALVHLGWEVLFITTSLSWLSVVRRDYRIAYPVRSEAGKVLSKKQGLKSFVWFTPWHPANLRLSVLNRLSRRLFSRYGKFPIGEAESFVADCELVIFESTSGLMLYDQLRKIRPQARFVYRVSDDLRFLRCHPSVIDYEDQVAASFDVVSVPSSHMLRLFRNIAQVRLQHHGIAKDLFDRDCPTPFSTAQGKNLLLVGTSHVDYDFLYRASRIRPDFRFHVIGPMKQLPKRNNILSYGELPFERTIPFLKHADIGLQARSWFPGAESLSDSLKVIQYTYCRLPIVAPSFMQSCRSHVVHYTPGDDESIDSALATAEGFDRTSIVTSDISSWEDFVRRILEQVSTVEQI